MGFVNIDRTRRGGGARREVPGISIQKNGLAIIQLGASADALGWGRDQKVSLQRGDGADAGWLRIALALSGGWSLFLANKTSRSLRIVVMARLLGAPGGPLKSTNMRHRIADGALLVRLPWVDDPAEQQEREFEAACSALRERGAVIAAGDAAGVYVVDGKRHSRLTLIELAEKRARVRAA